MCWSAASRSDVDRTVTGKTLMGISTATTVRNKRLYHSLVESYAEHQPAALSASLTEFFDPAARIQVVQPINSVDGLDGFMTRVIEPMSRSFDHLHRRADMLFGGEFEGQEWVVSHGHYVGEFARDWLGIPASGDIVWLHYIEYHRIDDGRAVETYLYFDLLDFLRQIGRWPLETSMGYEGFVPGPATADGILLDAQEAAQSQLSLTMVDDMLSRLYTEDEAWRPYWHRDMVWYGPSGYGSYIGVDGFARFQLPYESIFEKGRISSTYLRSGDEELDGRVAGHFARFGDGRYVASGGWPSHGGFMVNDWLGVPAEGQLFTVRVADIWRRSGDKLIENWVFVDVIDMLLQLGVDLFSRAGIEIDA